MELAYHLLNVFTMPGDPLSGNPLCVFEDGAALSDERMQALAKQFNLSETTFLLPPTLPGATARVRIFTPDVEMAFAGHPTLGTAHVVRALTLTGDRVVLEMRSGLVEVTAEQDRWTLRAPRPAVVRRPAASPEVLAAMVGVPAGSIMEALWVDTGTEQLMIPVKHVADVRAARADAASILRDGTSPGGGAPLAYVFAERAPGEIEARSFFVEHGSALEDPATGSACANLGGWLLATGAALPARRRVSQGAQVGRPSALVLEVGEDRAIRVSGEVLELGRGIIRL
jgi:PhzF family phenazine biosynthesis protein